MRQVLPRWREEGSCGRAVMAMFQVSRNIWSLYISPANRNEELPNSQFNLSFNLPCLMLLEKMTHLCVSLYSLVPLLPKVSNGVWRSPFCQPLLSLVTVPKDCWFCPSKSYSGELCYSEFETAVTDTLSQHLPIPIWPSLHCRPSLFLVGI